MRRAADRRGVRPVAGGMDLLVFSDDWGRHPSSCQHLVERLLPEHRVDWVDTIGTRRPGLDLYSLARAMGKLAGWSRRGSATGSRAGNPQVLRPLMWPSFRSSFGRGLNRRLLVRSLGRSLPPAVSRVAVTTLPLVADLVGRLPADRWVYYCVDDLSQWPGLDGTSLARMERDLVTRVDEVVAVSEALVERMASFGRRATLLTHGVDLDTWRQPVAPAPAGLAELPPPRIVFWGVVDRRLEVAWLRALGQRLGGGSIVLLGPENNPDPALGRLENVRRFGPVPFASLPATAALASVLVMPYTDSPATRAMQPLKLKEYLATGLPVVAADLPAVAEWCEACDVVASAEDFAAAVVRRADNGLPPSQAAARWRLTEESWEAKAALFRRVLAGEPVSP